MTEAATKKNGGAVVPLSERARGLVDEIQSDLSGALPENIPLDRFRSAFVTAVGNNPDLLKTTPGSLKTALLKCAADRLIPDGREAVILPFTERKKGRDGRGPGVPQAQYMPMVFGIRKRARELGGIASIVSEPVYEHDSFDFALGDDPYIHHKPPRLGQKRGQIVGAYAIFKSESGEIVHREVMDRDEIEKARAVSRASDSPAWTKFYAEMCRKTVVRRGAKSIPTLPDDLRRIIEREDEYVDFEGRAKTVSAQPVERPNRNLLDDTALIEGLRDDAAEDAPEVVAIEGGEAPAVEAPAAGGGEDGAPEPAEAPRDPAPVEAAPDHGEAPVADPVEASETVEAADADAAVDVVDLAWRYHDALDRVMDGSKLKQTSDKFRTENIELIGNITEDDKNRMRWIYDIHKRLHSGREDYDANRFMTEIENAIGAPRPEGGR